MTTDEVYCKVGELRSFIELQVPQSFPNHAIEIGNLYQIGYGDVTTDITHSRVGKRRSKVVGTYIDLGSETDGLTSLSVCAYIESRRKTVKTEESLWMVERGVCRDNFDAGLMNISRIGYLYLITQPPTQDQLAQFLRDGNVSKWDIGARESYCTDKYVNIPGFPSYSARDLKPVRQTVTYGERQDPLRKALRLFRILN